MRMMMTIPIYRDCLAVAMMALLASCVHDQKPVNFVQAVPQEPPRIEATIAPGALPTFQQKVRPIVDKTVVKVEVEDGLPAIEAARRNALIASAPDGFLNATQYFAYEEGALFELHERRVSCPLRAIFFRAMSRKRRVGALWRRMIACRAKAVCVWMSEKGFDADADRRDGMLSDVPMCTLSAHLDTKAPEPLNAPSNWPDQDQ